MKSARFQFSSISSWYATNKTDVDEIPYFDNVHSSSWKCIFWHCILEFLEMHGWRIRILHFSLLVFWRQGWCSTKDTNGGWHGHGFAIDKGWHAQRYMKRLVDDFHWKVCSQPIRCKDFNCLYITFACENQWRKVSWNRPPPENVKDSFFAAPYLSPLVMSQRLV